MPPRYFVDKKERFMQECANMGYDLYAVSDWLDRAGISEYQLGNFVDNFQNPNYVNVLR